MKRVNKTHRNLKRVWRQLDDACGSLYNAFDNISSMTDIPEDINRSMERIDVSEIVSLKNRIEELMEGKTKL